jgi:IS6 family transposase
MILNALGEQLKRRSKDDFKGRHFEAALILQAVSWYLRYPLSYRDIEELFLERGLEVDHSTLNRWVLAYAPLIERRLRPFRKPHCGSVRIDETYIKIRGQWRYLYRALDKHGTPVDFLLTAKRDLEAAKRFFCKVLQEEPLLSPDRIGTDGANTYLPTIVAARTGGLLPRTPLHYVTKHLQQGIESDHFRVKRPMPRIGGFQSFHTAGAPSRASRPCCGCARASASLARGRSASRTISLRPASDFKKLMKSENRAGPAYFMTINRVCDRPRLAASRSRVVVSRKSTGVPCLSMARYR